MNKLDRALQVGRASQKSDPHLASCLGKLQGRDHAVAPVVSLATDCNNQTLLRSVTEGEARHGGPGILHERVDWHALRNGALVGLPHLLCRDNLHLASLVQMQAIARTVSQRLA